MKNGKLGFVFACTIFPVICLVSLVVMPPIVIGKFLWEYTRPVPRERGP